jgi:hypothetical protein
MPCPSHVWHHLPNRRGVGSRSTGPIRGDDPASVSFPSVQCAWCTRPTASIAQEDENNMKKVPSFNHSSINSLLKPSGRHRNGRCSLAPRRGVLRRGSHGQSGVRQARPVRRMLYGAWVTGHWCSGEASGLFGSRACRMPAITTHPGAHKRSGPRQGSIRGPLSRSPGRGQRADGGACVDRTGGMLEAGQLRRVAIHASSMQTRQRLGPHKARGQKEKQAAQVLLLPCRGPGAMGVDTGGTSSR